MLTEQEKEVLKQLCDLGIDSFKSLEKVNIEQLCKKNLFTEKQAEIAGFISSDIEKRRYYDKELKKYYARIPKRQIKFFKENNINYDNIFCTDLLRLIEEIGPMTPGKISVFKEYKNQCLKLKFDNTNNDRNSQDIKKFISIYLEQFGDYLSIINKENISTIIRNRISEIDFSCVDIDLHGNEILDCLDIDYELKQAKIDLNQSLVVNILKKERKPINLFVLKNKISYFSKNDIDIQVYLNQLISEGFVKYKPEGIQYNKPFIEEFIEKNQSQFSIIDSRLRGETLESIGEKQSVTRERIRQKEKAELKRIPVDNIFESRYLCYFINYELTPEEFCQIFSINYYQYRFLSLYNRKAKNMLSKERLMESQELMFKEREKLEEILNKNFLILDNRRIQNRKIDLIEYLIEIYAKEEIKISDFYFLVKEFNEKNKLDFNFSSERALEGVVARAANVLLKYGRRLIHYNVDKVDALAVINKLEFSHFMNQEISARKILDAYPILLNEIDIYDEYELHNLLKRHSDSLPRYVKLSRMPFIEIGQVNREEQVINLLIEHSPISVDDFVLAYSKSYGVVEQTVRANFLTVIEEFKKDDVYVADTPVIDPKLISNLKSLLVEEFYFKEDVQKIFSEKYSDWQIPDFIYKKVGYKNYTDFILMETYSRADLYFDEQYFSKVLFEIKDSRLYLLGSFRNRLNQFKSDFKLFEYAKNSFISIKKLTQFSKITENDIIELLDNVDSYIGDRYFTYTNIEFLVEKSKLNELGFDNLFYESILKGADQYRFQNLGGTTLFKKTKNKFYSYNLLEEIVSRYKVIDIYDLIDLLEDKYNIKLSKEQILSSCLKTELYYNPIMEMIYLDIDKFYEMMEE